MYISRVLIDNDNRQKLKSLTHLGAYHDWVEQSFPHEINIGQRQRHLWRIDSIYRNQYLVVVSEKRPDLKMLEVYGVSGTAKVKDYQPFLDKIRNGELMHFRLVANPTYRKKGRVYPHITVIQQLRWLNDRALDYGFELLINPSGECSCNVTSREWVHLYHGARKKAIRLSKVTFEGILKVADSKILQQTLVRGIGREKAYGMGLLTVIPVEK